MLGMITCGVMSFGNIPPYKMKNVGKIFLFLCHLMTIMCHFYSFLAHAVIVM